MTIDIHLKAKIEQAKELMIRKWKIRLLQRWKRFCQVRKSSDNSGSGLGLSIVKWIVEANGGTIELRSSLGIGTEFVIYFPGAAKSACIGDCRGY